MSALEGTLVTGLVISLGVVIVGVCSQGRLKHWILVVLGASPRAISTPFDEIPRAEHDWAMLARLRGLDQKDR